MAEQQEDVEDRLSFQYLQFLRHPDIQRDVWATPSRLSAFTFDLTSEEAVRLDSHGFSLPTFWRTWLRSYRRDVRIHPRGIVLAHGAEDIEDRGGTIDRHGAVRHVRRDDKERPRFDDAGLIADGELDLPLQQDAPLFMGVMVQRDFGPVIHFEIRQHEVLPKRRPHAAAGDGLDGRELTEIDEGHEGVPQSVGPSDEGEGRCVHQKSRQWPVSAPSPPQST